MVAVLVAVSASRVGPGAQVFKSLLLVAVATLLPVAMLIALQVRRGRWTNVDASNVSERPVLFVVALAALAGLCGWLLLTDPRSFLVRGVFVTAVLLLVAAVLTRWIKLSLHLAFAGLAATSLSLMGSPVGYALIAMLPLLAWSRLALSRHRANELLVGLALGVAAGIALVRL